MSPHEEPVIHCKICMTEHNLEDVHKMQSCQCIFCYNCVRRYVDLLIEEGNILRVSCPDALCPDKGVIEAREIAHLVNSSTYERYMRLKLKKGIDSNPSKAWCPLVNCDGYCEGQPGVVQRVVCPECSFDFCFLCKQKWHPDLTCTEYAIIKREVTKRGLLRPEFLEDASIKQCPSCRVLIQREEGCAQMMCANCKHMFCWYCLQSLNNDILLRHYDSGPCRNKLGHSRISLFFHRTQVVGSIALVGIMVLVASPFILILSPCLLFTKCKYGSKTQ